MKKITRRMSVGTILGGLFAPKIAGMQSKDIQFPHPPPSLPPSGYTGEIQVNSPAADPFYKIRRIKHLQKQINGEFEDWQLENLEQSEQLAESPNIIALKSVSLAYKWEMVKNHRKELQKQSWIKSAMKELKEITRLG